MKKVLITGADGFIGRHLVKGLLDANHEVYAIVYPGNEKLYKNIECENFHVYSLDINNILNYVRDFPKDIDVMYHFAWSGVKPELRNDLDMQVSNINMSLNCMKFAIAIGINRIILPGSTSEYQYYDKPINKAAVPSPNSAYGATKVALRYLCGDFCSRAHVEYIYTIITGIYAEDRQDNNVIYYTINKLLNKEKPSLTKLEQLWDYVYIDDVIEALILIGINGKDKAVYAIGHGDNWKLLNYIKIIHDKIDNTLPLGIGEVSYSCEVLPSSCIDLTDLTRDTGFIPKTSFEDGITKVINKVKKDMEDE